MNKQHWLEAIVDTGIGLIINLPINFLVIAFCYDQEFTASQTTIFATVVFTVIAIFRKVGVRRAFDKKSAK
jgi:uncharacterized membrane protein